MHDVYNTILNTAPNRLMPYPATNAERKNYCGGVGVVLGNDKALANNTPMTSTVKHYKPFSTISFIVVAFTK